MAKANLEEASVNLGYTTIRSPVKGVILDRRVNIGQTVVASLNAPSLFLIAKDLSRMEIWASVNETDIGSIHVGQAVRFTVGAFPRETFRGQGLADPPERQHDPERRHLHGRRRRSTTPSGKLLPYLTARLQFEVEERQDVLLVPNAALRWQPPAAARRARGARGVRRDRCASGPRADGERGQPKPSRADEPTGTLWVKQGEFVRPVDGRASA